MTLIAALSAIRILKSKKAYANADFFIAFLDTVFEECDQSQILKAIRAGR